MIIVGKDCEDCMKSTFDETNKSKIMVYCASRDKWYIYGMCIPCDEKVKKKNETD
jgi:hypothetical protein